jgi:hypothetical protein
MLADMVGIFSRRFSQMIWYFTRSSRRFSQIYCGVFLADFRRFSLMICIIFLADLADLRRLAFLILCDLCVFARNISQRFTQMPFRFPLCVLCGSIFNAFPSLRPLRLCAKHFPKIYADAFPISPMCSMWLNFH